ncbi:hypothetical protein ACFW2T_14000 [Streptomyces sp. NPDC058892]|uniref:hypothetical protein n=1 Tax=unclassified Streptomyces TaxID=2593676 RepID=UPI00367846DF
MSRAGRTPEPAPPTTGGPPWRRSQHRPGAPLSGAPLSGAPLSGAPLSGAPLSGARGPERDGRRVTRCRPFGSGRPRIVIVAASALHAYVTRRSTAERPVSPSKTRAGPSRLKPFGQQLPETVPPHPPAPCGHRAGRPEP